MHRRRGTALQQFESHFGPNMTPMVDVVMVILIFFMASSAVLGPDWFIRTSLPVPVEGAAAQLDRTIRVRARLTMDGNQVRAATSYLGTPPAGPVELQTGTPAQLEIWFNTLVRLNAGAEIVVVIEPAPEVPYAAVVQAHEAAVRLRISKVGLGS